MQNKKGISLIVLVITIIVMIILAAAIIISLDNSGIINKANQAVTETDLAEVRHIATLKWSEAYLNNKRTQAELDTYVKEELVKELGDISKYEITVTEKGVDVTLKNTPETGGDTDVSTVPEKWKSNVVAMADNNKVPIPKGFVASPYDGEKTKDGGLVIYELAEGETAIPATETHHTSLTTRNQYVWVPVDDFSKFVRGSYDNTTYSNELGKAYWEVVLDTTTNMPLPEQDANYMTSNILSEVQAMYESVKEYGGFYIARYEVGISEQRIEKGTSENLLRGKNVYSRMNKIPYTYIPWTWNVDAMNEDTNGAVEVSRSVYPNITSNTTSVVSTLIYGVQWDATFYLWLDIKARDINGNEINLYNSNAYGNYSSHIIETTDDLNEGAKVQVNVNVVNSYVSKDAAILEYPKASGTKWLLSTGALKASKVNNIYDMSGNIAEATMEGNTYAGGTVNEHTTRGGEYYYVGDPAAASVTHRRSQRTELASNEIGFRFALYIKK